MQVTVEQRDRAMNVSQEVRTGVLFMVDLAGSERAAVTQVIVHIVVISTVTTPDLLCVYELHAHT